MLFPNRAKDIAAGMQYLEDRKVVHRSLALRNLLVSAPNSEPSTRRCVKISNAGLHQPVPAKGWHDGGNSNNEAASNLVVRWCAPEVLEKGQYSSQVQFLQKNSKCSMTIINSFLQTERCVGIRHHSVGVVQFWTCSLHCHEQ